MNAYREYDEQRLSDALQLAEDLSESLAAVTRERDEALRRVDELAEALCDATAPADQDIGSVVHREELWKDAHQARQELRDQLAQAKRPDQLRYSATVVVIMAILGALGVAFGASVALMEHFGR